MTLLETNSCILGWSIECLMSLSIGGLMNLLLLFWIRNGLLLDVSEKDVLLIDGQELCDNRELAQQF